MIKNYDKLYSVGIDGLSEWHNPQKTMSRKSDLITYITGKVLNTEDSD